MTPLRTGALACALALVSSSQLIAQTLQPLPVNSPATPAAATSTRALEPFVARYQVLRGGQPLGAATLQLVRQMAPRWRVDLTMRGTGIASIAGLNAEQSTVFDAAASGYRPVSQATRRTALFTKRATTGTYDWSRLSARWTGDVKETRRAPVALREGDMSGLLINLAVVRDARPGAVLDYRFVDDGRVRDHRYVVASATEAVAVDGLGFDAMRVARVNAGTEETVIWVADGVPTPIRMLQRENGEDTFDLRLVEYRGVP